MDGKRECTSPKESEDGIEWERPELGLFPYDGDEKTNIVMPGSGGAVIIDPKGTGDERYKVLANTFASAIPHWPEELQNVRTHRGYLFVSPDGLKWKRVGKQAAVPFYIDTLNQLIYDERIDRYVAYLRTANVYGRAVARCEIDDPRIIPWPLEYPMDPKEIEDTRGIHTEGKDFPVVLSADDLDPPDTDIYTPAVVKYRSIYLAFPSIYRHYPEPDLDTDSLEFIERQQGKGYHNDGPLEIQLAAGRDGISFRRIDRSPYIPLDTFGGEEGGQVYMGGGMVEKGEELWQYYTGCGPTHGHSDPEKDRGTNVIRRLVQQRDRFMAAAAGPEGGAFTTPPLKGKGKELVLNADCGAMGHILVEIADAGGKTLEGFSFADSGQTHMVVKE